MKLFKRAFSYLSHFKGNIALIFIFNILYSLFSLFSMALVVPFLTILFSDHNAIVHQPELAIDTDSLLNMFYYYLGLFVNSHGQVKALFVVAATMILFSLITNVFRYAASYSLAPVRSGTLKNIRSDIYRKLLILPLSFYTKHKRGDIITRFGTDVQEMEWSVISTIQVLCRDPFLLLIYLFTLLTINWKLTIITLLILPISGFLISFVGKFIKRYSTRAQETLGKISSKFEEAMSGLRIIKAYNAIDHASEKFGEENHYFAKVNTKLHRVTELGAPLIEFLSILSLGLILFLGFLFMGNDAAFKGEIFVFYIVIFARMLPPAKQLVTSYNTIQKGNAAAKRIFDVLDSDEKIIEVDHPVTLKSMKKEIEYRNVSFNYLETKGVHQKLDVLHEVNFVLKKGEVIALVGASGSGKSTLIDLLPRFYDVTAGEILIDDININQYSIKDLREFFGIVNQDVILFNDTVFNNIAFGMENATEEKVIEAAKKAQAHDFIMRMPEGYRTIIGEKGMKLSGGERQRLSIARMILKDPEVLILDEATSALDTESELLVQESIEKMVKGKTAIIIAHRLSTIRNADKILFFENGRIVEEGTHAELTALQQGYYRFCNAQELKS